MKITVYKSIIESSIKKIINEAKEMADVVLSSNPIKELLEDIKELQGKSEAYLKQNLKKLIKKDSKCREDLAQLDKMYVTKGNREKLLSRLVKKIKEMDCLNLDMEEDKVRRFLCAIMHYDYQQISNENLRYERELTNTKFEFTCELLRDLECLKDLLTLIQQIDEENSQLESLISSLYSIGQHVGMIQFINMVERNE